MKNCFAFIAFFSLTALMAQSSTEKFFSKKLNAERHLLLKLPKSYNIDAKKTYPLIVILDGDYLFQAFDGALEYGGYWDDLPEVILVGIMQNKNEERFDDTYFDEENGLPDDTGAAFFEFITNELMPHLEKTFRIAPFKVIAGHDLTAGYLNYFLLREKSIFDGYLSFSPEFASEMTTRIANRLNNIEKKTYYYLSTADGDLKSMRDEILALNTEITATKGKNTLYAFDLFENASHYSLVLHSIPKALYHLFAIYQPITMTEFQEKIVALEYGYVNYLESKYLELEKSLNIKIPIRINDFKAIEAAILKNKAYNEFEELSILARKSYPNTMLADYHMALMFEKKEDYKRAQRYYLLAFQKQDIGDLNKDMMFDRSEDMKRKLANYGQN
jgi:uncharacterized protein